MSDSSETGSATSEFVLVALPMLSIFLASFAIVLSGYVKTVILDATIEGARYAALADQDLAAGALRARQLISSALGAGWQVEISGSYTKLTNPAELELTTKTQLPFGLAPLVISSRALSEADR